MLRLPMFPRVRTLSRASIEMAPAGAGGNAIAGATVAGLNVAELAENAPPAAEQPVKASAAPEVIRQATLRILRDRVELLGIDKSGAYQHYNLLLSRGFPIPSYEIAILDLVRRRFADLDAYHEIGSGLGTLPLMLAHDGFLAVGIERDEPRHLTAVAILRDLAAGLPGIERNCRLIGAPFPDAIADLDVSGSMAILTDFVSTHSEAELVKLCEGLAKYRYVLLDLQRFCCKRESLDEQQALIEELGGYGLSPCPEQIELGSEGSYRLFAGPAAARMGASVGPQAPENAAPPPVKQPVVLTEARAIEVPAEQSVAEPPARLPLPVMPPRPRRTKRRGFIGGLGLSALLMIGLPTLIGGVYYGFWAADQYVTTFEFAVRGPAQQAKSPGSISGSLSSSSSGMMSPDSFVVADFINSHEAVVQVEKDVDLREIFSRPVADFWARLDPQVKREELDQYWKSMVESYFDMISGNIFVTVRAFTPEDSLRLAQAIINEADVMFQKMNEQARRDFVKIADENLANAEQRQIAARSAVEAFRSAHGVLFPDTVAQSSSTIVDAMRQKLGAATAQYDTTLKLSPKSPLLPVLQSQIAALERQITTADRAKPTMVARVTTPEELRQYTALENERQIAESLYGDAVKLRQEAYIAAQQQQSFLALFVQPHLATQAQYPARARSIVTIMLAAAVAWFVSMLITYAIRDHLIT